VMDRRYRLTFSDNWWGEPHQFLVRVLTRGEMLRWMSLSIYSPSDAEEFAVRCALLNPVDTESLPAGIVSSLAEAVLALSGILQDHPLSEYAGIQQEVDTWLSTPEGRMEVVALTFLNGISLESLWSMNVFEWTKVVVAAMQGAVLAGADPNVIKTYVDSGIDGLANMVKQQRRSGQNVPQIASPVIPMSTSRRAQIEPEWQFSWRKE